MDEYDYNDSYERVEDSIPKRLKEMGINRENWAVDVPGRFMDGELILYVIQRKGRDPLQLLYAPNDSLAVVFEDLRLIAENGGSPIRLTPPPGWVAPEPESNEGEEWKNE